MLGRFFFAAAGVWSLDVSVGDKATRMPARGYRLAPPCFERKRVGLSPPARAQPRT
jgi:hypothetical protein